VLCPTIAIPLLLTLLSISTTFSPQPHSTPPKKARPGGQGEHMRLCVTLEVSLHTMQLSKCGDVAAGQSNYLSGLGNSCFEEASRHHLSWQPSVYHDTNNLVKNPFATLYRYRKHAQHARYHPNERHPSEQANVASKQTSLR